MANNYVDNIKKKVSGLFFPFDIHDKRFPETTGSSSTTTLLTVKTDGTVGSIDTNQIATSSNKVATVADITSKINALDVSDSAVATQYVSAVSETNGKISVSRENFSPSITITAGDANNAPKVNVTVNGNSGTAQSIGGATTSAYGATKLTSTINSSELLSVTPKGVKDAIEALDITDTADGTKYVSAVSETDGKISVTRASFSPSVSITAGTGSAAPKVNISVAGNNGTAQPITTASTSVYGVTKLSSTVSNDNTTAITPAAVADAIASNTGDYISNNGDPFTSVQALETYTAQHPGEITNNDYAIVTGTDSGNVYYDRYKATVSGSTVTWSKEYRINNSSFSTAQWDAINSGITSSGVTKLSGIAAGAEVNQNAFSNVVVGSSTISADAKQDTLTLEAGSHITLTADTTNDKITIAFDDTIDGGTI